MENVLILRGVVVFIYWFLCLVCVGMMLWLLGCSSGIDFNTVSDVIFIDDIFVFLVG